MECFVYILISASSGRFYIGQTSNLDQRLRDHNAGRVKSTKNRGPWTIFFSKKVNSRADAVILERKLKNLKSRKRILAWIDMQ